MGQSKKRKQDESYGKAPSRVPTDYLKHHGFEPCFGYVYTCQFKDFEPCIFTVPTNDLIRFGGAISFSLGGTKGLVTIDNVSPSMNAKIDKVVANEKFIHLVARPVYSMKYTDFNGLQVLPFVLDSVIDSPTDSNIQRHFYYGSGLGGKKATVPMIFIR